MRGIVQDRRDHLRTRPLRVGFDEIVETLQQAVFPDQSGPPGRGDNRIAHGA